MEPFNKPAAIDEKPNCWDCKYFLITHDAKRPYSCSMMGFKSRRLPCHDGIQIEGERRYSFLPKIEIQGKIIKHVVV